MPPAKTDLQDDVHDIGLEMAGLKQQLRSIIWLFSIGIGTVVTIGLGGGAWAYSMHGTVTRLVTNQERMLQSDSTQTTAIAELVRATDVLTDRVERMQEGTRQ